MLHDAGTATEQLVVALAGRGAVEVQITCLVLAEYVLGGKGAQFHVLDVPVEELYQFLTADPPHTAGHHGLDGSLRGMARQKTRAVGHELALKREPREVVAPVAQAPRHIFEASVLHVCKPPSRVALALKLLALAVVNHLALPLAKLVQRLQVDAAVRLIESLFHWLFVSNENHNIEGGQTRVSMEWNSVAHCIKTKRPADLSIVKRLGGFSWYKGTAFILNSQTFLKKKAVRTSF